MVRGSKSGQLDINDTVSDLSLLDGLQQIMVYYRPSHPSVDI